MDIYFDETGNSGQNLLDNEQPVYVLVSHNFTVTEAENILRPLKSFSDEFHFTKMKKYPKYQKPIENIVNHELICYERIKIAYYNKRYALCAHLVNLLVETVFHKHNMPYYEEGLNIAYAQSLYLQTEYFDLKYDYLELINLFQKMIREKDETSVNNFYNKAEQIFESITEEGEKNFFFPILLSRAYINGVLASLNKLSIDLAFPSITLLSDVWHKTEDVKINIIHDESKQVDFWKEFIMFLSKEMGKEKRDIGFDTRKMIFPLQIESVETVDSKKNIQIQLADILAGSFALYAKNILLEVDETDKMSNIIANSKLANMNVHPLQPDLSFFDKSFEATDDDVNPLDYLAKKTTDVQDKFDQSYPR